MEMGIKIFIDIDPNTLSQIFTKLDSQIIYKRSSESYYSDHIESNE
jgi:hypothetical protein